MASYIESPDGAKISIPLDSFDFKDLYLEEFMAKNHKKYITYHQISIICITFNVNTKPPKGDLFDLFDPPKSLPLPHIYAISLQEMDLGTEALLRTSGVTNREQEWLNEFSRHLSHKYIRISRQRLLGITLVLFISQESSSHVTLLREDYLATGLMGIIGNKGGLSVSILYHNTTIVFVGSHFPAHDQNVIERNQNFLDISRQIVPPNDIIFWLGDLNYRLNSLNNDYVRAKILAGKFISLLPYDQLTHQKTAGQIFVDYFEPPITFPPTYKFDPCSDTYDSSAKSRVPAWTDRVLFSHNINNPVDCLHYSHLPSIRLSDHKPVRAYFNALVGSINSKIEDQLKEKFYSESNKIEMQMQPKAHLSTNEVHFGNVCFMEFVERTITVANVGDFEFKFDIINVIENDGRGYLSTSWLTVEPHSHTLPPKGEVCVHLAVYVTLKDLKKFKLDREGLTETVVVRLVNGSHHFVSIEATFQPTSFGKSLDTLCRSPLNNLDCLDSSLNNENIPIPMELYHMIEALVKKCGNVDVSWFTVGDVQALEISRIIRIVDGYYPISDLETSTPSALFLSILLFISSLNDPLIPETYRSYILENLTQDNAREIVELLPLLPRCNFAYLMSFFRYISTGGDDSEKKILAAKIQSALFQVSDYHSRDAAEEHKRNLFVLCFLTMDNEAFRQICSAVTDF